MDRKPRTLALTIAVATLLAILTGVGLAGCGSRSQRVEAQAGAKPSQPAPQSAPVASHTISVTFDYDFKKNPPCLPKAPSKTCVRLFNVYDVSGGRYKLFWIPVPTGATGLVKNITGKSPLRPFEVGTHFIAVTAENASGVESDVNAAKVSVEVKPAAPPAAGAAPSH